MNSSRKRKPNEVQETPLPTSAPVHANPFPLPQQEVSTALCLDLNGQQQSSPFEENSNMSIPSLFAPFKSFTALLTEDDDEDPLPPNVKEILNQTHQMIKYQADHLSRTLENVQKMTYKMLQSAANERAEKKLKEKELELCNASSTISRLQAKEAHLRKEVLMLRARLTQLESSTETLSAQLQAAIVRGGQPEGAGGTSGQQQEDGQSSHVGPDRVEPIILACRGCGKKMANMMLWPCRHVCICKRCEGLTRICPVCHQVKQTSTVVYLQ